MDGTTIPISQSAKRSMTSVLPRKPSGIPIPGSRPTARGLPTVGSAVLKSLTSHVVKKTRPSALAAQLQAGQSPLQTAHRTEIIELLNMGDYTSQTDCAVEVDQPIFQPFPPLLEFQGYHAFEPCVKKLVFRNNDKFARRMKVLSPDSPFFRVEGPFNSKGAAMVDGRVAPGTEVVYNVTFTPRDVDDYQYEMVCATEREKFVVPLRAWGKRAVLVLPDALSFPTVPVKCSSTKTFVVRNAGKRGTEFRLVAPPNFAVSPTRAYVEVDDCVPVTVTFEPDEVREYGDDITLIYAEGYSCLVDVNGAGGAIDVGLSQNMVALDATYVSLNTMRTVTLTNDSDVPVEFSWKRFRDLMSEDEEKYRRIETAQMSFTRNRATKNGIFESCVETKSKDMEEGAAPEDDGPGSIADLRRLRAEQLAIEREPLLFYSDVFSISPMSGTLWSKSSMEFTITFAPNDSKDFSEVAYVDVSGRPERLPLALSGTGIGPRLAFAYDVIDVGEVTVTSVHRYELLLMNRGEITTSTIFTCPTEGIIQYVNSRSAGEIPARWNMGTSSTPFGSKFLFDPVEGHLDVDDTAPISVYFTSDVLGPFSELFEVRMQGCSAVLRVHFKGVVVPPAFALDTTALDFGEVPFDFTQAKSFLLENHSDVPFSFAFRIPEDARAGKQAREFQITPARGFIAPASTQSITVEFTSSNAKQYVGYEMILDIEKVGEALLRLPIVATCIVPTIALAEDVVDFKECFVRHSYERSLTLENKSAHPARYRVVPQDEHSQVIAQFTVTGMEGVVPAAGVVVVPMTLTCYKVGPIVIPAFLAISGASGEPLKAELQAKGRGPLVACEPQALNWGNITCLQSVPRLLQVHNKSDIPAPMHFAIKHAKSKFTVELTETVLQPHQSISVPVNAYVDDTLQFVDELQIHVTESDSLSIPLIARGTGHTVICDTELDGHDFGALRTSMPVQRVYRLTNNGRRNQTVSWVNVDLRAKEQQLKKAERGKGEMEKVDLSTVYTVTPSSTVLKPGQSVECILEARSETPRESLETLELQVRGESDRTFCTVASLPFHAIFVHPLLTFLPATLEFSAAPGIAPVSGIESRSLCITNVSPLPVTAFINYSTEDAAASAAEVMKLPITVSASSITLAPSESRNIDVRFDASYRLDKQGHILKAKLAISYDKHPRCDIVPIIAEARYPNLTFETSRCDFGCILNDTIASRIVRCTNKSDIDAHLTWSLLEDVEAHEKVSLESGLPYVPINEVFDIRPLRFCLRPHETLPVEMTFYGHAGRRFETEALCLLDGGPEYRVRLSGEANMAAFRVDKQLIDFGKILYDCTETREFTLFNVGKVEYDFSVEQITSTVCDDPLGARGPVPYRTLFPAQVEVVPSAGRVMPGEKAKITVKLTPGVPDQLREMVRVRVGHFEPVVVRLEAEGVFTNIVTSLPRLANDDSWSTAYALASTALGHAVVPGDDVEIAPLSPQDSRPITGAGNPSAIAALTSHSVLQGEASRLLYRDWLINCVLSAHNASREALSPPKSRPKTAPSAEALTLHKYVLDFGNIIQGTIKKKNFTVLNPGRCDASLMFERAGTSNSPFVVEPSKVPRLPPTATVDVTVSFDARPGGITKGKEVPLGPYEIVVPVKTPKGPVSLLIVRGIVTLPELRITPETLDFGQLYCGQQKILAMQFHNVTAVPLSWSVVVPLVASRSHDREAFLMVPETGTLAPGERCLIHVTFTPTDARAFMAAIPVKINQNPKQRTVVFKGAGVHPLLRFENLSQVDPPQLSLGPLMPFDKPAMNTIRITNDSQVPVEVFSLDCDAQYQAERDFLISNEGIFADHPVTRIASRQPGVKLQTLLSVTHSEVGEPTGNMSDTGAELAVEAVDESRPSCNAPRAQGRALNIVVVGPAFCGASEFAKQVGANLQCAVLTLNDVVAWAREGRGGPDLANMIREYVKVWPIDHGADGETMLKSSSKPNTASSKKDLKDAKQKAKTPEQAAPRVPVSCLIACLQERLLRADCSRVAVIDGTQCDFLADALEGALVIGEVLNGQRQPNTKIFNLDGTEESVKSRQQNRLLSFQNRLAEIDALIATLEGTMARSKSAAKVTKAKPESSTAELIDSSESEKLREQQIAERRGICVGLAKLKRVMENELDPGIGRIALRTQIALVGGAIRLPVPPLPSVLHATPPPSAKSSSKADAKRDDREEEETKVFPSLAAAPDVIPEVPEDQLVNLAIDDTISLTAALENALPQPPEDSTPFNMDFVLPAPQTFEIVRRPVGSAPGDCERHFRVRLPSQIAEAEPVEPPATQPVTPGGKTKPAIASPVKASGKAVAPTGPVVEQEKSAPKFGGQFDPSQKDVVRFVLAPGATQEVAIQFASPAVGEYTALACFGVVGSFKTFPLNLNGICSVPTVSTDPRSMFMHRVKARPEDGFVLKKYVSSRNTFEFGPLLGGRNRTERHPSHCTKWRICNNGLFPASISLSVSGPDVLMPWVRGVGASAAAVPPQIEPPANEKIAGKEKGKADGKEKEKEPHFDTCFSFEPPSVDNIPPGEFAEVVVWAFPQEAPWQAPNIVGAQASNVVMVHVKDNPDGISLPISCLSTLPQVDLRGPWDAAGLQGSETRREEKKELNKKEPTKGARAKTPAAAETDMAPFIDFDKLLVGRSDVKSFSLTNVSLIPIVWRLDMSSITNPILPTAVPTSSKTAQPATAIASETKGPAFKIGPVDGKLEPGETCSVDVTFGADYELVRSHVLAVEYADAEGGFTDPDTVATSRPGSAADAKPRASSAKKVAPVEVQQTRARVQRLAVGVRGEVYKVVSGIRFDDLAAEGKGSRPTSVSGAKAASKDKGTEMPAPPAQISANGALDFGLLRVAESAQRVIPLSNAGKYAVSFKLVPVKGAIEDLITASPSEGVLQPSQDVKITVTFQAQKEVKLNSARAFSLQIIDVQTNICTDAVAITATAQTAFSRFTFVPTRALNFGPLRYGSDKERKIEIRNTGLFPMDFRMVVVGSPDDASLLDITTGKSQNSLLGAVSSQSPLPAGQKGKEKAPVAAKPTDKKSQTASLSAIEAAARVSEGPISDFGRFHVENPSGTIAPGSTAFIAVRYFPAGATVHKCQTRIHVSNFDRLTMAPEALLYELIGESCVPGIVSDDYGSIFEEHMIVPALHQLGSGAYVSSSSSTVDTPLFSRTRCGFGLAERTFSFGSVIHSVHPKGVSERIKLMNPFKVPATVTLGFKSDDPSSLSAFTVTPQLVELPPHESRYVELRFVPTSVRYYSATLTADVEGGIIEQTRRCSFQVCGDGALPTVSVLHPDPSTRSTSDGSLLMAFGKVPAMSRREKEIILKNTGLFPVVVKMDMTASRTFKLEVPSGIHPPTVGALQADGSRSLSLTVLPDTCARAITSFEPTTDSVVGLSDLPGLCGVDEEGLVQYSADITVNVQNNPFEQERIRLRGGTCIPDLVVEGLASKDGEDCLTFPSVAFIPGGPKSQSLNLTLVSNCDYPVRFEWSSSQPMPLIFHPRCGHIPAQGKLDASITYSPDESNPASWLVDNTAITLSYAKITYDSSVAVATTDERIKLAIEVGNSKTAPSKPGARPTSVSKGTKETSKPGQQTSKDAKSGAPSGKSSSQGAKKTEPGGSPQLRKRPRSRTSAKPSEPVVQWNNDETAIIFLPIENPDARSALDSGHGMLIAGGKEVKILSPVPEPPYAVVVETEGEDGGTPHALAAMEEQLGYQMINAKVTAVADVARVVLDGENTLETKCSFAPTMMLQSRTLQVSVTNTSKVDICISWERQGSSAFSIMPSDLVLYAGQNQSFTIKFAPPDAEDFEADFLVRSPQLDPAKTLHVRCEGRGQRPICHLDVPPSDYLSHRKLDLPGPTGAIAPLDAAIRVLELRSLGVAHRCASKFFIVNPTSSPYEFTWDLVRSDGSAIRCVTPKGMVMAGKRYEVAFEFMPTVTDVSEAFWRFSIPSAGISQMFLVAGVVREPRVSTDKAAVVFRPLLLGASATDTVILKNEEDVPLRFECSPPQSSLGAPAGIKVQPASAMIPARGTLAVIISFLPVAEGSQNVNIPFLVERKSFNLVVNVKGEAYGLHDTVALEEDLTTAKSAELSASGPNFLDFGSIQVHEKAVKKVVLRNLGAFAFDFQWLELPKSDARSRMKPDIVSSLSVSPLNGKVPKGGELACTLEFHPSFVGQFQNFPLALLVAGTKRYQLLVSGKASQASIDFSTLDLDFGDCFCPPAGSSHPLSTTQTLRITNKEKDRDVNVNCIYERKPYMEVGFDGGVLRAGQTLEVPVTFSPRIAQAYHDSIQFELNSLQTVTVQVHGEGLQPLLDVVPVSAGFGAAKLSEVSFGSLKPGQSASRAVRLNNRSRKHMHIEIVDSEDLSWGSQFISFPKRAFVVRARDSVTLDLIFAPTHRVEPFKRSLFVKLGSANATGPVLSDKVHLCTVTGACLGMDISLETDVMNFGTVCEGANVSRPIVVYNTGDLPAHFRWQGEKLLPHFSVSPMTGTVPPQSEAISIVTFHPQLVIPDIRVEAINLLVDGYKRPLALTVHGDCVSKPAPSGAAIQFSCKVRESITQSIPLPKNETDKPWTIFPVITHEYWTGPTSVEVPAKSGGTYTLTYKPLSMTKSSGPEQTQDGSVFFPLPDGSGLTYALVGKALPPAPSGSLTFKTSAKKILAVSIPITNWLRTTQALSVSWDSKTVPSHVQLRGPKTIDIPGLGTREYKMTFVSLLEGKINTTVTFTNEASGEYAFYDISVECGPAGTAGTITLESVVRHCVSHLITIENPLAAAGTPVSFSSITCDHPAVRVVKLSELTGQVEGNFRIDYRPLMPTSASRPSSATSAALTAVASPRIVAQPSAKPTKEKEKLDVVPPTSTLSHSSTSAKVVLHSDQLGDFIYDLKLRAIAAAPEPPLRFSTSLGSKQVLSFSFRHFDARPATYKCMVSRPDVFLVPAVVTSPPAPSESWEGVECSVEVTYEGLSVGDTVSELVIASDAVGSFTVPLFAACAAPRPSGPFVVSPGSGVTIDFRNVFNEDREFVIATDNPSAFSIAPSGIQKIARKASIQVGVKYNGPTGGGSDVAGRLSIAASGSDLPPWIYYLRGTADASAVGKAPSRGTSAGKSAPGKKK